MTQPGQPFLETLYHLRTVEHVILYNRLTPVPHKEQQEVIAFLESEYEREITGYPFTAPVFSPTAALWGAKTVYTAAQLFLYRENNAAMLTSLLPGYNGAIDASAMLSADLCLRFLPSVKHTLEAADINDPLLPILQRHLTDFPYSGISPDGEFTEPDIAVIISNNCLRQLYLDRVTEKKATKWAGEPVIKSALYSNLGNYKNDLWREFNN